jgi:hypothetical protein
MTDLLKELDAVAAGLDECTDEVAESHYKALRFLRTHRAEIAESLKDARRYRWLRALPGKNAERAMCPNADGGIVMFQGRTLDERIDANLHNSAREAGE